MVSEMILDNTECPIESLNSDIENNFGVADEIATKDMKQGSENTGMRIHLCSLLSLNI